MKCDQLFSQLFILFLTPYTLSYIQRFFDTIRTPNGVPLSDHYGVKMTLTDYREDCAWYEKWSYFCGHLEDLHLPSVDEFPIQQELEKICLPLTQVPESS